MIIWGSTSKEKTESEGEFNCPGCEAVRNYRLIKVSRYFTLYFIPLFATDTLGKYVKCNVCNKDYNESVLEYVPPTEIEKVQHSVYLDLSAGMPIQMVTRKLQTQSWSEDDSRRIVHSVSGDSQKTCHPCQLSFFHEVSHCSGCGNELMAN